MRVTSVKIKDKGLYILGMIHRDRENGKLTDLWLDRIKPHVVTLEFSQYGLKFRKEKGHIYRKRIESVAMDMRQKKEALDEESLAFLCAYVDLPSEYESSVRYCRDRPALLYLLDMDLFSYLKLRSVEELLNVKNIRKVLEAREAPTGSAERALARLYFDTGVQTAPYTDEMLIRDKYMSRRLQILMRHHQGKRFVHITGWRHLKDPDNLFACLGPTKVFPYD
ncbi:MAG TPA: hypothetical protein VMT62_11220 [Syntrophorhabdaceae bacterium]|nr:hypothetical protein [Syntrophorhabdaceae bacterium]